MKKTFLRGILLLTGLCVLGCGPLRENGNESKTVELLDRIATYQQHNLSWVPDSVKGNHHDHGINAWTNAVFYLGLSKWADYGKTTCNYYDWLLQTGNTAQWKIAANFKDYPRYQLFHADEMCMGQFYLRMYDKYKEATYLRDTQQRADWIINNVADSVIHYRNKQIWSWCDALFMAPPVYAHVSKLTGEAVYLEYMHRHYLQTYNHLYDKENRLFYRDDSYFDKREENGEKIFWGRGNGWVISGLANLLDVLPPYDIHRSFYENLLKELAGRLTELQNEDGFWHASLLDPENYPSPETSATALIVHGIAYGINNHLLNDDYLPVVKKAWNALCTVVNEEGRVGFVQPIGADPRKVTSDMTAAYGSGTFLMAGIEILILMDRNKL